MEIITNVLSEVPTGAYLASGGALAVSLLLEALKKWTNLQSDKMITFLLMALSFGASALEYLMTAIAANPGILGTHTAVLMGLATVLYRYIVKPSRTLLQDAKAFRSTTLTNTVAPIQSAPLPQAAVPATIQIEDAVAPVSESEFAA